MANNHEVATVNTKIPARLLSEADLLVLSGFGFESEDALGNKLYLYAEDGTRAGNEFEVEVWPELVSMLDTAYPPEAPRPEWVGALLAHLVQYGQDDEHQMTVDMESMGVSWEGVLQGILSKPQNTGEDAIDAIEVMAGYWCDKARAGEFGGWAVRITRDDIQSACTSTLLFMMAKGEMPSRRPRFVVAGRIPGADDDSVKVIEADDEEAATEAFVDWLYSGVNLNRDDVIERYGKCAFIVESFELKNDEVLVA
jgi:hypothetical protein